MNLHETAIMFEHAAHIAAKRGDTDAADLHALRAQAYCLEHERRTAPEPDTMYTVARFVVGLAAGLAVWATIRAVCLYFYA